MCWFIDEERIKRAAGNVDRAGQVINPAEKVGTKIHTVNTAKQLRPSVQIGRKLDNKARKF